MLSPDRLHPPPTLPYSEASDHSRWHAVHVYEGLPADLEKFDTFVMSPPHPAPRAARSSSSVRINWQDFRQAARTSRAEGVRTIFRRDGSVEIIPLSAGDTRPAGTPQVKKKVEVNDDKDSGQTVDGNEPMDTQGSPTTKMSKRDAARLAAFKTNKRWLSLVRPLLHTVRRIIRDEVWTEWMRARVEAKQAARRKLRNLLWRGWTHRFMGGAVLDPILGLTSRRDEYIRTTVRNRCRWVLPAKEPWTRGGASKRLHLGDAVYDDMTDFGLTGFDPDDVQAAIAASLADTSDLDQPGRQAGDKSSSQEAGVSTPQSARARKKGLRRH